MRGFFPPLLLLLSHQLLHAQASPASQAPAGSTPTRTRTGAHRRAHMWRMLSPAACACTQRRVGKQQTLGGRDDVIFALSMQPPPFEAENSGRRANNKVWHLSDLVPLGCCTSGLFFPGCRLASRVTGAGKESEGLRNKN